MRLSWRCKNERSLCVGWFAGRAIIAPGICIARMGELYGPASLRCDRVRTRYAFRRVFCAISGGAA